MSVAGTVLRLGAACKGQTGTVSSGHSFSGGGIGELYWLTWLDLPTSFTNLVAVVSNCRLTQVMGEFLDSQ